jgi:hypothetical protein
MQFDGLPFLMLYGENEPMIEPHAENFERQFHECQTVEVPTANHNAQVGNPEFTRTQIRTFLKDAFDEYSTFPVTARSPQKSTAPAAIPQANPVASRVQGRRHGKTRRMRGVTT